MSFIFQPLQKNDFGLQFKNSYNQFGTDVEKYIKGISGEVENTLLNIKGQKINAGVTYPLYNTVRDGVINTVQDIVKNAVLSAKVHGAKRDKYYMIEWIGNGYSSGGVSYWGMQLSEFNRDDTGRIDSSTRRLLLNYRNDKFPQPAETIVSRTIDLPSEGLIFEVTYDRSVFVSALNIANGESGRGLGCVIHQENYNYRLDVEIDKASVNKIIIDKQSSEFTVYRLASNGNYVGINMLFAEKALDTSVLASNYKLWSVKSVKEYKRTNTFVPIRTIIDNSATTMDTILREKQTTDYTGGLYHGDEVNEEVILTIDGKVIPINTVGMFVADELRIMQRNKLYRDNQYTKGELQQFGTVGKEHIFNVKDGYSLSQVITFQEPVTLTMAIMGALPLYRVDDKGVSLWNTFYSDIAYVTRNIAVPGENTPEEENVQTVVFIGSNVSCVYKEERTNPLPGNRTWVNNTGSYAKLYNSFCPSGYVTKSGEQFKQITKYYFDFS